MYLKQQAIGFKIGILCLKARAVTTWDICTHTPIIIIIMIGFERGEGGGALTEWKIIMKVVDILNPEKYRGPPLNLRPPTPIQKRIKKPKQQQQQT